MFNKLLAVLDRLSGPWLIFIAAVLWSTVGGVSKSVDMETLLFGGFRALIGGVALLPLLKPKQLVWDKWLIGLILSYTGMTVFVLLAIRFSTAGNAIALQDSAPLWLFLWALFIKKQKPGWRRIIPIVLITAGIAIFLLEPNTGSNSLGNILGVFGGISYALYSVCMRRAKGATVMSLVVVMNLSCGALILLGLWALPGYQFAVPLNAWPVLLLMGTVQLSGGHLCFSLGLRKTDPQRATLLAVWELILSPVWAFLLVSELPTAFGFIGWLIMLAAIVLENKLHQPQMLPANAAEINAKS